MTLSQRDAEYLRTITEPRELIEFVQGLVEREQDKARSLTQSLRFQDLWVVCTEMMVRMDQEGKK